MGSPRYHVALSSILMRDSFINSSGVRAFVNRRKLWEARFFFQLSQAARQLMLVGLFSYLGDLVKIEQVQD